MAEKDEQKPVAIDASSQITRSVDFSLSRLTSLEYDAGNGRVSTSVTHSIRVQRSYDEQDNHVMDADSRRTLAGAEALDARCGVSLVVTTERDFREIVAFMQRFGIPPTERLFALCWGKNSVETYRDGSRSDRLRKATEATHNTKVPLHEGTRFERPFRRNEDVPFSSLNSALVDLVTSCNEEVFLRVGNIVYTQRIPQGFPHCPAERTIGFTTRTYDERQVDLVLGQSPIRLLPFEERLIKVVMQTALEKR